MSLVQGVSASASDRMDAIPVPASRPTVSGRVAPGGEVDGRLGFSDLLDVINPLQHIPGVSEVYRAVTHDEMSEGARFAGNALYGLALGGPVGLAAMTAYSFAGQALETYAAKDPVALDAGAVLSPYEVSQMADSEPVPVPPGKPDQQTSGILGVEIGTASARPIGSPVDLARLSGLPETPAIDEVAVAEPRPTAEEQIQAIAGHSANHLPMDVLKVLQERHETLVAHEQS